MSDMGRRTLTDAELDEFVKHSKNDYWIWVGSDIRILVGEIRHLRRLLREPEAGDAGGKDNAS